MTQMGVGDSELSQMVLVEGQGGGTDVEVQLYYFRSHNTELGIEHRRGEGVGR